jgi:hypothetical protein
MVFCENCGSKLKENSPFCPNCGVETEIVTSKAAPAGVSQQDRYIPQSYQQSRNIIQPGLQQPQMGMSPQRYHSGLKDQLSATPRSWGAFFGLALVLVIILTAVTPQGSSSSDYVFLFAWPFGIVYAIYIYFNFNDFQTHLNRAHSSGEYRPKSTISPSIAVLIVISSFPLKLSLNNYNEFNWFINSLFAVFPIFIVMFFKYKMLYEHLEEQGEVDKGSNGFEAVLFAFFSFSIAAIYLDWKWQDTFNKHLKRTAGFHA